MTSCEALKGALAQITEVYTGDSDSPTKRGVAIAAIISGPLLVAEPDSPKKL